MNQMKTYEMTLPDGRVTTRRSTLDLTYAVVIQEIDQTKWDYISCHATYEAASKRKNTLWTRSVKGGKNARRNWLQAIKIVELREVAA